MGIAAIKIASGVAGQADLTTYAKGGSVALSDVGVGTPDSRLWTIRRWPAPLSVAPTFSPDATSASVSFTGSETGCYLIVLTRVDLGVTSTDEVLVGIADEDTLIYPAAGVSGRLVNPGGSLPAQEEGWGGHARSSTNKFLDAFLRFFKRNTVENPELVGIAGRQVETTTTFTEKSRVRLDVTRYARQQLAQYRLRAFIMTGNAAEACELKLRNETDASDVVTITTTATTVTFVESGLQALPAAGLTKDYSLQLRLGSGGTSTATCMRAWLELFI